MLNYIWFGMMFIAVIVGIFTGNIDAVTEAAISMSKTAVEIAMGLIGIMALWLGTMKIAEESGLIRILSKAIRPITIRLFPDVPEDRRRERAGADALDAVAVRRDPGELEDGQTVVVVHQELVDLQLDLDLALGVESRVELALRSIHPCHPVHGEHDVPVFVSKDSVPGLDDLFVNGNRVAL